MVGCFTLEKETSSWFLLHLATLGQPTKIEADFEQHQGTLENRNQPQNSLITKSIPPTSYLNACI